MILHVGKKADVERSREVEIRDLNGPLLSAFAGSTVRGALTRLSTYAMPTAQVLSSLEDWGRLATRKGVRKGACQSGRFRVGED